MADAFNPYVEWLGLSAQLREPNHYQLLNLGEFEADIARITIAADKAMSRVRSFRPGPNAKAWSKLLDELLLAKAHLTDPDRKIEYDAELRETVEKTASSTVPMSPAGQSSNRSEAPARTGPDPRFPPGMGPNGPVRQPQTSYAQPEPEIVAPTMRPAAEPAVDWHSGPAAPAPAPLTTPAYYAMPAQPLPVLSAAVWPDSMLHPAAHAAPVAQPMHGAPQQNSQQPGYPQAPQAYPTAMPTYGQPAYGQQAMPYGQPPLAQPQMAQPLGHAPQAQPGYGQPYSSTTYAQPQYAQSAPYAQPAYGAAPYAQPQPGMPYGMPAGSQPAAYAGNYAPQGYASYPTGDPQGGIATSMPLDPMAPVAVPTAMPGPAADGKQGRGVGFAAAGPPTEAIPKGKAVAPTPVSKPAHSLSSLAEPPRSAPPMMPANAIPPSDLATLAEPTSTEKNILYGTIGAVVFLIGAIAFVIAYSNRGNNDLANNPDPSSPDPQALPRIEPTPVKPVTPPTPKPEQPKPQQPNPVQPAPVSPTINKRPTGDPFADPPMNDPMTTLKPPVPEPIKPEPAKPESPKPDPEPAKPEPIKPEPAKPEPPKPEPTPPKPPEPAPEVKLTPVELATLSKAMTTAREALSERNFEEFETQYAVAKQLAKTEDQKAKAGRLLVLGDYVKQFDRQLKSLLADENFDAGAELVIGSGTRVVVVERDSTMIIIRINGMNKTYSLANLPAGLAIALMDKRLNATDPVRHLVKGAYFATVKVQTEDTKQRAKDLFEQGTREGADAGDLALVLTDTLRL